jgi:hypothetical protein
MKMRERVMALLGLGVFGALFSLVGDAHSDRAAFRCGDKLISKGTPSYRVEHLCGAPAQRSTYREYQVYGVTGSTLLGTSPGVCGDFISRAREIVIDEWIYDLGPHKLTRHLVFHQGKLERVETAGYGVLPKTGNDSQSNESERSEAN